ncbi:MAG: valine--tRNA ligase [Gemmataceae bacterium]|nr:valine--tRNA ligase [Gemmataceae bacterium]
MELAKAYNPQEAQEKWLKFWNEQGYFHSRPDSRKPYTIVIPPPNVTGALHMGHALNNTLQDVLIRWRRMQDYNALWMPGTDHAGIATQAVVERLIMQQEKKTRHDIGRDRLVKRIWEWKDKYEARILGQLRQLGASCDWERTRFTLDPICARAVRETFFKMFKDGLIFRGKRLVNWDTHLQTSVADDETYTEDIKGGFWTFKYQVKPDGEQREPSEYISFSTTRPETMLGDTAICVHPSDERYKHLIGKSVTIPLVNRDIPIIADGLLADPTLGTGCVKVTPAHDPNDYACYQRNPQIGIINILNPDGTINENGGKYQGMDRYKAREAVVADMEALGLFEGREDRIIPMKYSDRSKTPIEPYLSDQWFVKMGDPPASLPRERGEEAAKTPPADAGGSPKAGLARMAMEAVENGHVKFFPERYANSYLDWLAEKRDWCISRQLWWGHRIPVWKLSEDALFPLGQSLGDRLSILASWIAEGRVAASWGGTPLRVTDDAWSLLIDVAFSDDAEFVICVRDSEDKELIELLESAGFVQDPDVLDTWFSSMLWPHSTLGWPEPTEELKYYYPTSVLVTSRDIITLWVARMVIAGLYNLQQVPFHQVYITVKLMDGFGETMSKSKGNGVDPLDIIERYGADALRFLVMQISTETQDARLPVANACPHCDALVPVKQEHMYMRTKKLACPNCKQPFRPGGPWPSDDPELKTAKQASERFEIGRNFANKIWNAARFILMNLDGYTPHAIKREELTLEDRWILSRLAATTQAVTEQLEGYRFSDAARSLYDFVWSEFCDWYLEMTKGRLRADDRETVQRVLIGVLDAIVRLVHPVMPFVAESIWSALNEVAFERGLPNPEPATESVMIAPWPEFPSDWRDAGIETSIVRMQELVRSVREVRNRYNIEPKTPLDAFVKCGESVAGDFRTLAPFITLLGGIGTLDCGLAVAKPSQAASHVTPEFEVYVSLAGLIDPVAETKRLEKQLADKRKALQSAHAKSENPNFVKNAPPEIVQQLRDQIADLQKQIETIEGNIKDLQQT